MFQTDLFKTRITELSTKMTSNLRGELDSKVERAVLSELSQIYITMTDRYSAMVENGSAFPAQPEVGSFPQDQRVYRAILDLLERMELDFVQKFTQDFVHGLEKEVEIGKIKIAFLDGIRRSLNEAGAAHE